METFGIDVSAHQGYIDWERVARYKTFAIIKASEGVDIKDARYTYNISAALKAGMVAGPYHYYRPGHSLQEQANNFYDAVSLLQEGNLIPWLDVEDTYPTYKDSLAKQNEYSYSRIREELLDLLPILDNKFGCRVGIYTGLWFWDNLDMPAMERPLWLAYWYENDGYYDDENLPLPKGFDHYDIHQYTNNGIVPGIVTTVDLNRIPGDITGVTVKSNNILGVTASINVIRNALDDIEKQLRL